MILYIFGDSITQGLWDTKGGWATRIVSYIQACEVESGFKNYHEAYNLGIDGNMTRHILNRFENETKARFWPDATYAFLFATGTNDTLHRDGVLESSTEQYESELSKLVEMAKQYSNKIAFVDITPVDEGRTNPIQSSKTGKSYTNDVISKFNQTLHDFCEEANTDYIEVNRVFAEKDHSALLIDGLHPNDAGHTLIFDQVKPWVDEVFKFEQLELVK